MPCSVFHMSGPTFWKILEYRASFILPHTVILRVLKWVAALAFLKTSQSLNASVSYSQPNYTLKKKQDANMWCKWFLYLNNCKKLVSTNDSDELKKQSLSKGMQDTLPRKNWLWSMWSVVTFRKMLLLYKRTDWFLEQGNANIDLKSNNTAHALRNFNFPSSLSVPFSSKV